VAGLASGAEVFQVAGGDLGQQQQPVVSFGAGGHPLGHGRDAIQHGAVLGDAELFLGGDGVKLALVGLDQALDGSLKGLGGAVHFATAL
jgi:hypothetical protein